MKHVALGSRYRAAMLALFTAALVLVPPSGSLIVLGGGRESDDAFRKLIELAHGPIVVLDQSREEPGESANSLRQAFVELGASEVRAPASPEEALIALHDARGVYMSGGNQNLFMQRFPESSGVPEAIRGVLARGGVVGGTSAGASLIGEWMPTGDGETPDALNPDPKAVAPGLGLWRGAILDQHFLARARWTRLISFLLQTEANWGLGVEERAWVLVQGSRLQVFEGPAVLLQVRDRAEGQFELKVLRAGQDAELTPSD